MTKDAATAMGGGDKQYLYQLGNSEPSIGGVYQMRSVMGRLLTEWPLDVATCCSSDEVDEEDECNCVQVSSCHGWGGDMVEVCDQSWEEQHAGADEILKLKLIKKIGPRLLFNVIVRLTKVGAVTSDVTILSRLGVTDIRN